MRKISVRGVLAAIGLMAASEGAYAGNVNIDCTGNPGALATEFNSTHPGGQASTNYFITGPCNGNIIISQSNIAIVASSGTQTINGTIQIVGAGGATLLRGLAITGGANFDGVVLVMSAPEVLIQSCTIQNGPGDGIGVFGPARVLLSRNTIQNNAGIGLHAFVGAIIDSFSSTVTGNGGVGVLAENGSNLFLTADTVTGPSNNHTVLVSRGSNAVINGATITADTPFSANNPLAVLTAERSSTITLAGGNTITNSAAGGAAVLVSEASTLVEDNGIPEGNLAAADTVNGDGRVNTQSVIELGAASGGGGIDWTGNVFVSQFSSFRADGENVTITGTLSLGQAGNAYFNETKGTSNNIAHVVCQSTTDHVANPTLVTPNVMIGNPPNCASF